MASKAKQQSDYTRRIWALLHSMAAYYPSKAPTEVQTHHLTFIKEFMDIGVEYEDFGKNFLHRMEQNPPRLDGREDFAVWLCEMHNEFNSA